MERKNDKVLLAHGSGGTWTHRLITEELLPRFSNEALACLEDQAAFSVGECRLAVTTGRGTGIDDAQLKHKTTIIEKAIKVNQPDPKQPLSVLAKVGGLEIGGLAGVMLGAGALRIPVVIDGFISGAAALIAAGLAPNLKNFMIAGHMSVEPGHKVMLNHLGLKPLVNLGLRLGEGTGAALGIFLCETSTRILSEMATFAEAGVSEKD